MLKFSLQKWDRAWSICLRRTYHRFWYHFQQGWL